MKVLNLVKIAAILSLASGLVVTRAQTAKTTPGQVPAFEFDPTWPKLPLPNNWLTGNVGALYVDKQDHIWVAQRPNSTTGLAERYGLTGDSDCCLPAPPVMEFDTQGNLIQAWGPVHGEKGKRVPGQGTTQAQMLLGKQPPLSYPLDEWPTSEHGIFVDHENNVWIDSQSGPSQLLKMSHDGKQLLMRIGKQEGKANSDTTNLAGPTGIYVDPQTNEVFVADGYRNRRVIVFDAKTGAYKRHWGAYGKPPIEGQSPETGEVLADRENGRAAKYAPESRRQQFDHVHCLTAGNDGLLYVCDRANDRIQVFRKDGTYVKEGFVHPEAVGFGSVLGISFSPDKEQRFMYVVDIHKVWIVRREDMVTVGSFSSGGRNGGQLILGHTISTDSNGNVYVGETVDGNRVQKFKFVGMRPSSTK
jgi:DNA-binding beta-propeller fold protein YncE